MFKRVISTILMLAIMASISTSVMARGTDVAVVKPIGEMRTDNIVAIKPIAEVTMDNSSVEPCATFCCIPNAPSKMKDFEPVHMGNAGQKCGMIVYTRARVCTNCGAILTTPEIIRTAPGCGNYH